MSISFQDLIKNVQDFWQSNGCIILQPYDTCIGAGTFHFATSFCSTKNNLGNVAYVQACRRPKDARFASHPNRAQHYYQLQVILNPASCNFQDLYINSLSKIGITPDKYDINFIEDDWKSTTLGAFGLGWEVVCNGMEISQLTYMYQIAGKKCSPIIGEITYGLERIALITQNVSKLSNIIWSNNPKVYYGDIFDTFEKNFSQFNLHEANIEILKTQFNVFEKECKKMIEKKLPYVAYDYCLAAIHMFNLMDSRKAISLVERETYIQKTKDLSVLCIQIADST